jgi:hypothetical protein
VLRVCLFQITPIIGSKLEDKAPQLAICQFVCSDAQPDAESCCRDALYPRGFQVVALQSEYRIAVERLRETDKHMFEMYQSQGQALRLLLEDGSSRPKPKSQPPPDFSN